MKGTSRTVAATGMAATGVAAALILGFYAVVESAVVLPLTLEALFLAGVTWFLVLRYDSDEPTDVWLGRLLLAALVVRLGLAVGINFVLSGSLFAPDVADYEYFGRRLSQYWQGEVRTPGSAFEVWQAGYHYVNGAFFYLFGGVSPLGPVVLNIFVSLWTVILGFRLGCMFGSVRMGKALAVLVAFFPSLVLWSVLNIRDAISTFLVTLAVYVVIMLSRRVRGSDLLLLGVALLCLSLIRQYMVVLVVLGAVVGLVAIVRKGRVLQTMVVGGVLCVAIVFGVETLGILERVPAETPFEAVAGLRESMTIGAGSTFGAQLDPSTPTGALLALPVGLVYLLFAPFPWTVSSLLQMLTLPEVLLWYLLLPFTVFGVKALLSRGSSDVLIPVGVLMVVLSSYALVEGNMGTAYRHRAQIMPLLFLFTAAGIVAFLKWNKERREKRHRRRRAARASMRRGSIQ